MLIPLLAAAALAPGLATTWLLRHRGWTLAVLAGVGVTVSLPFLLLSSLIAFPPLGFLVGGAAVLAALSAYDRGAIWVATAWAATAVVAFACAGWSW